MLRRSGRRMRAPVVVSRNGAKRPPPRGVTIYVLGEDDQVDRILLESFGQVDPLLTLQAGNGTAQNPLPRKAGKPLGGINFRGYDGSDTSDAPYPRHGFSTGAVQFRVWATEDYGPDNHGARATISTTPKGAGKCNGKQDRIVQSWEDDGRVRFYAYRRGNAVLAEDGTLGSTPHARPAGGFFGLGPAVDYEVRRGVLKIAGSRARFEGEVRAIKAPFIQDGDIVLLEARGPSVVYRGKNLAIGQDRHLAERGRLALIYYAEDETFREFCL